MAVTKMASLFFFPAQSQPLICGKKLHEEGGKRRLKRNVHPIHIYIYIYSKLQSLNINKNSFKSSLIFCHLFNTDIMRKEDRS